MATDATSAAVTPTRRGIQTDRELVAANLFLTSAMSGTKGGVSDTSGSEAGAAGAGSAKAGAAKACTGVEALTGAEATGAAEDAPASGGTSLATAWS